MVHQLIINGIISGSIYILIAIGFMVIYGTVKFFHFAHGIVFTAGAYLTYLFKIWLGWPLFFSIPMVIGLCAVLGGLIEHAVYRPFCYPTDIFTFPTAGIPGKESEKSYPLTLYSRK
jgi:branched-chain amino acid transport system permease protein